MGEEDVVQTTTPQDKKSKKGSRKKKKTKITSKLRRSAVGETTGWRIKDTGSQKNLVVEPQAMGIRMGTRDRRDQSRLTQKNLLRRRRRR